MIWRNSRERFGVVHVLLHWTTAVITIGLFALGLWMVDLDYYHAWYNRGPDLHRSFGIVLALVVLALIVWRSVNTRPAPLPSHSAFERWGAVTVHVALYLLVLLTIVAGYLISTADGRSVSVFGWFDLPPIETSVDDQADIAGEVHFWLALVLIVVASMHALAALKHHFKDRDATLRRMLGKS